jgi:acyl-CoA synthetase (AMP-forming)/AMP-acid ligase II
MSHLAPDEEAIWSRTGSYTWSQVYNKSLQYAKFYLEHGVRPKDIVAFYLTNSPEFVFAWLGLWAIGCAPAMINFHLNCEALIHCVKLTGSKMVLVDWDEGCRARIEESRLELEKIGIKIVFLDDAVKQHIDALQPTRPPDSYRSGLRIRDPGFLLFTRYVHSECFGLGLELTADLQWFDWFSKSGPFQLRSLSLPRRSTFESDRNQRRPKRRPMVRLYAAIPRYWWSGCGNLYD